MKLYFIACSFKTHEYDICHEGFAVCIDINTPTIFIYPNGQPYLGSPVWSYKLHHLMPWAQLDWRE